MSNLEVVVRVRPAEDNEESGVFVTNEQTLTIINKQGSQNQWNFSRVCDELTNQETLFTENVSSLLGTAIDGKNVSIICYGPTGTGKTYTMSGTANNPGIVPR